MMSASRNQLPSLAGLLLLCCWQTLYAAPPDTMTVHFYLRDTFCSNQSLFIGNQIFDFYSPSGTVLFAGAAADGSDSIVHVDLVYREPARVKLEQNLCAGDTVWVNGKAYHANFYLGEETIEGGAANGCDSIIEVNLRVVPPPVWVIDDTLCPADFRLVNGVRYDQQHPTGMELLPGAAFTGCDSLVQISLTYKDLQLQLGQDRTIISGDTFCLQPMLNFSPTTFAWVPEPPCLDPACLSACLQPLRSVAYQLTAMDSSGCQVSAAIRITVSNQNRVYVPNVFQPEAAEPNNHFFVSTDAGVTILRRLFITDRWGETLFDAQNLAPNQPDAGWDGSWRGRTVPPGVYLYWSELERRDGSRFKISGTVTLLR